MLLHAVFIPPDQVQDEIDSLMGQVSSALGGLDEGAARPFRLPVTGFGNLTNPDATRVVQALDSVLAEFHQPPVIRFSTLTIASDGAVRLGMAGDVDEFVELARHVPKAVERLHLYVDRRQFWPGLVLGRTSAPPAALGDLGAWIGSEWQVSSVAILRRLGDSSFVHADVQIGTAALL